MGIGFRIKEAREQLGLTQTELGNLIGVTGSAITNYEKGTSHPKEHVIYKLFSALKVDANYLFQDEMGSNYPMKVSYDEMEHIKKYRILDEHGKEMVDFTLLKEWERSTKVQKAEIFPMEDSSSTSAIAARNDFIDEEGQFEKTQEDIARLQRPD